jgi:hypothetical protein
VGRPPMAMCLLGKHKAKEGHQTRGDNGGKKLRRVVHTHNTCSKENLGTSVDVPNRVKMLGLALQEI